MQCRGKWAIGKTLLVEQRHLDGDAIITALLNKDGSIGLQISVANKTHLSNVTAEPVENFAACL